MRHFETIEELRLALLEFVRLTTTWLIERHGLITPLAKASGYSPRALVEADICRYKRVIGDALRSHSDGRQLTEVAIAVGVLNRMLELGRPECLRIT
ncbi:MAG: hypothetical protein QOF70_4278 [Acetobacteraceae bacterium]|nr:hypothetical protein [Acetobacteraceae bacterium]